MSLFNKLIALLSGRKKQKAEPVKQSTTRNFPAESWEQKWERERQERIQAAELELKEWIIAAVKEKGRLPFTWESGNDEAFVTFKDSNDAEEESYQSLEEYIIDKLDLPDAGEFEMTGSGTIFLDGSLVKVTYSSTMKTLVDYDEETEQEIYSEKEEQDSGQHILFTI